jgi:hypothetical protein
MGKEDIKVMINLKEALNGRNNSTDIMDTDSSYWTLKENNILSREALMWNGPNSGGVVVD